MEQVFLNDYLMDCNDTTVAIQKAIDDASKRKVQLVIQAGTYTTGTLFLRSDSDIYLEKDAVILGSDDIEDYPDTHASFTDAVGEKRGKTLILAYECDGIRLSGDGKICGNGESFKVSHPDFSKRPFLFRIVNSKNVNISGISLTQSAAWCLHINNSEYIDVNGITIHNRANSNNDGIDIDASSYVNIKNCDVNSGDDAICLKATTQNPCKHINIESCRVSSGWAGFKIGTESVGDISHVKVSDCFFYDIEGCGIKIVPVDGSNVEDIKLFNNEMVNSTGPIFIATGERLRKYAGIGRQMPGTMKNIVIDGLKADTVRAKERGVFFGGIWGNGIGGVIISGTEKNFIDGIVLKNLELSLPGGETEVPQADNVPEMLDRNPEFHLFDPVPAKGIYMRHAKNVSLLDVSIAFKEADVRELIFCDDVDDLVSTNVRENISNS